MDRIKLPKEITRSYFGHIIDPKSGNISNKNFLLDRTSNQYKIKPNQDIPYFGYTFDAYENPVFTHEEYLQARPYPLQVLTPFIDIFYNIDTRERNTIDFPNTNTFSIDLINKYNIFGIELVNCTIPQSQYTINSYNNKFYFEETVDTLLTITINPGNYTINELITVLQNELNTVGNSSYLVTLQNTYNINISSDVTGGSGIFNILNNSQNILNTLGYNNISKTGSFSYTSENRYNLNKTRTALLHFYNIPNIEPFVVVLGKRISLKLVNILQGHSSMLNKLAIRLTNLDGTLYENNNTDYSIYLKIKYIN